MINVLKEYLNLPVVVAMLMLLLVYPYMIPFFLDLPKIDIIIPIFGVIVFVMSLFGESHKASLPKSLCICMIIQGVAWILMGIYHSDTSYFTRNVLLITAYFCLIMLIRHDSMEKFLKVYGFWIMLQAFLGAVAFVLVFANILKPLFVNYEYGNIGLYFYGITCTNSVIGNFIRPAGFFDEPGALACWGMFAMLINQITYKNKVFEIVCSVALLFTWSAAYFVLLTLYLLLFYLNKSSKSIGICLLLLLSASIIFFNLSDNEEFRHMTVERFEGGHIRSKRDLAEDVAKEEFEKNIWLGVGGKRLEETSISASDNPFEVLAKDGIIGYLITYLPILIVVLKHRNKEVIFSSVILMASYMQRPFHINEMHFLMIYLYMYLVEIKYQYYISFNMNEKYENSSIINMP